MVGRTAPITREDQKRFDAIAEIGCLACMIDEHDDTPATAHHITDAGQRLPEEHKNTVGLCPWHHQGQPPGPCNGSKRRATELLGPSLAEDKRKFVERYGTEEELVLIQDALVRQWYRALRTGWYMTPGRLGKLTRLLHRETMARSSLVMP